MKQSGLKNRFSSETRHVWLYWYDCLICGMNQIDTLHHIVSPSSRLYVDGDHNESVLNSCPIHNMKHPSAGGEIPNCHIGNEAYLYADETIKSLLNRVVRILLEDLGYQLKPRDIAFIQVYKHLYESDILKRSKLL